MSLTSIRLREAWNWGGLSAKELAIRTWHAMDQHKGRRAWVPLR
jgi:hypothetical protein